MHCSSYHDKYEDLPCYHRKTFVLFVGKSCFYFMFYTCTYFPLIKDHYLDCLDVVFTVQKVVCMSKDSNYLNIFTCTFMQKGWSTSSHNFSYSPSHERAPKGIPVFHQGRNSTLIPVIDVTGPSFLVYMKCIEKAGCLLHRKIPRN